MPFFTDKLGRTFRFELTPQIAESVQHLPEFAAVRMFAPGLVVADLLKMRFAGGAAKYLGDRAKAVIPLAWLLCRQQPEHYDLDDEDFCRGMDSGTINRITTAIIEAIKGE